MKNMKEKLTDMKKIDPDTPKFIQQDDKFDKEGIEKI